MEEVYITKSHNKSLLLYHFVCSLKYRRDVFTEEVEVTLKKIYDGISARYEINFIEIGSDEDHVHFLVKNVHCIFKNRLNRHKDLLQKNRGRLTLFG